MPPLATLTLKLTLTLSLTLTANPNPGPSSPGGQARILAPKGDTEMSKMNMEKTAFLEKASS